MHGVFIPSNWYFCFALKAILPDLDGVNTLFHLPFLLFNFEFRGRLLFQYKMSLEGVSISNTR